MGGKAKNIKKTEGFLRFLALLGGLEEVSVRKLGWLGSNERNYFHRPR